MRDGTLRAARTAPSGRGRVLRRAPVGALGGVLLTLCVSVFARPVCAQVPEAGAMETRASEVVEVRSTKASPSPDAWPEGAGLPVLMVELTGDRHNVIRTGPGDDYAIAGVYPQGARLRVMAKNGDWYNVRLSNTTTGWVHASLCDEYEDLSALELRPNPRLYSRVGSFGVSGYTGGYSFDRKSNSLVVGGRVGYYLLDFLQIEGG